MQCMVCHRELPVSDAAFCPYCGAAVQTAKRAVPQEVKALLRELEKMKDPVKKHEMLTEAEKKYPESLEIAEEALFLGRLYERSAKVLDYSVIKCYLLHMYLTPETFAAERKNAMREELFRHPQLMRCLALTEDKNAFLRRYLNRLCTEFITIFLMSSTTYTKSFFGFRLDHRMGRVLAEPACAMLCTMRSDEELDMQQRALLYNAFYRAFVTETGGEPRWLDELLEKKGISSSGTLKKGEMNVEQRKPPCAHPACRDACPAAAPCQECAAGETGAAAAHARAETRYG